MPTFNKNKIYNRMPANANEYLSGDGIGIMTGVSALLHYLFNNDDNVDKNINESVEILKALNGDESASDQAKKFVENKTDKQKQFLKLYHSNLIGLEDAKDIYLQMPQRSNTFQKSDKSPKLGKLNNPHKSTYLSNDDFIMQTYLLPAYHNILKQNIKGGDVKNLNPGELSELGKSKQNAVTYLPILGASTVGAGIDEHKGPYVSYYDTWDVELSGNSNGKDDVVSKLVGGKPFDIYDRIYLDDYYGVNSSSDRKDTYYGGYLPEIKVLGIKLNQK